MAKQSSFDLVTTLEPFFAKAPALPKNGKDGLVKIMPWVALIFGVLGIFGAISAVGLLSATSPFALMGGREGVTSYGSGFVSAIFWLVSAALLLAAYPGLKGQKAKGWTLMFWSEVVSIVGSLVSFEIVSAIISALIGFYLLFQIRSYYK